MPLIQALIIIMMVVTKTSSAEDFDTRSGSPGRISITATNAAYKTFPGDRGLATPFTFSWSAGSPTKTAKACQSGIFTDDDRVGFDRDTHHLLLYLLPPALCLHSVSRAAAGLGNTVQPSHFTLPWPV